MLQPQHETTALDRFRARLAGRDRFPAERLREFADRPALECAAAARNTRQVASRLRADWGRARSRGMRAHDWLSGVDLELVSCDHGWRDLFAGLARLDRRYDAMAQAALNAYLDYLGSRERALSTLARTLAGHAPARM